MGDETMLRAGDPRWAEIADEERDERRAVLKMPVAERLRRGERLSRQAVRLRAAAMRSRERSARA